MPLKTRFVRAHWGSVVVVVVFDLVTVLFLPVVDGGSNGVFRQDRAVNFDRRQRHSSTISVFLMAKASSTVRPFIHSVAKEEEAIAEPQPKHLNLASSILPASSTLIWSCITSPHSGAPTMPTPISERSLTSDDVPNEPTFCFGSAR